MRYYHKWKEGNQNRQSCWEDEGYKPLTGQIVLERLDLVIEPSRRKVIPNSRFPESLYADNRKTFIGYKLRPAEHEKNGTNVEIKKAKFYCKIILGLVWNNLKAIMMDNVKKFRKKSYKIVSQEIKIWKYRGINKIKETSKWLTKNL